jgi:hypothetical protein
MIPVPHIEVEVIEVRVRIHDAVVAVRAARRTGAVEPEMSIPMEACRLLKCRI